MLRRIYHAASRASTTESTRPATPRSPRRAQPNAANGCTGTRGPGAADLQSDCTLATQGALGKDAFAGAGQANTASGNYASISGGAANVASGNYASTTSGQSNTASGNFAAVSGGTSNVASGNYATISGASGNTASGTYSLSGGASANDYGRLAANCWSSTTSGYGQTCIETLVANGSGSASSPLRLTVSGAPSATNAFNIPDNSDFSLRVNLTAIDATTLTTSYSATWTGALNLSRMVGAATTALNGSTSSTAAIGPSSYFYTSGPLSTPLPGQLSADNSNGGLSVTFVPPNGDRWHVAVRIESTEVK